MGDTDVPFYWIKPGVRVLAPHPMDGPKPATIEQVYRSQINSSKGTAKARWDHDQYLGTVFFNKQLTPLNKTTVAEAEGETGDFKDVWGSPPFRTFHLEFDEWDSPGTGYPKWSTVVSVPTALLQKAGNDPVAFQKILFDYAHDNLDAADERVIGDVPRSEWDYVVTWQETDPQSPVQETEDFGDEEIFKDVMANPAKVGEYGYFVYFSRPVEFATPWGPQAFTKIGPYHNTYEAARKKRFGLMNEEGVTAWIKRERITFDPRWGAMFEPPVTVA